MVMQRNACAALIAVAETEAEQLQVELQQWNQAVSCCCIHTSCTVSASIVNYTAAGDSFAALGQSNHRHSLAYHFC